MTDTPAPTTQAGRRLIDMLAQIDPEPQGIGWVRNAILNIESEARSTQAEALTECDHPASMLTTSTYNGPDGRMAGVEQRCECGASWRKVRGRAPAEALDVERLRAAIFRSISDELDAAYAKHGREQWGRHEFYAILLEEVDEVWDAIKADEPLERVAREAIQVAAMCIRYMETGDRYQGAIGRVQSPEGTS